LSLTIAAMPAYNEERSITEMVLGCQKYVDRVVVVDDASTDATAERAASAGAHVIRHEWNAGYGAALRTCIKMGADRTEIIDSEGQQDAPLD
jgi:glycosyltransferase involved in cell wall biosynthesis